MSKSVQLCPVPQQLRWSGRAEDVLQLSWCKEAGERKQVPGIGSGVNPGVIPLASGKLLQIYTGVAVIGIWCSTSTLQPPD